VSALRVPEVDMIRAIEIEDRISRIVHTAGLIGYLDAASIVADDSYRGVVGPIMVVLLMLCRILHEKSGGLDQECVFAKSSLGRKNRSGVTRRCLCHMAIRVWLFL